MTEADLVEGCLRQDRLSQKKLFERYKDAMYTLAFRVTADHGQAEDVLQEAFLSVFSNISQFRKDSTIGAWIKTIVIRKAIRAKKSAAKYDFIEEVPVGIENRVIDWGDFLHVEYLEKAIQSLSAGYRAVFILIEVEGYSHKEVAKMLSISEGTSKSQLFHAKRKLRAILSEQNNN